MTRSSVGTAGAEGEAGTWVGTSSSAGYAEADPTFDVDGHDTAHKLAILTSLAFGTEVSFETFKKEYLSRLSEELGRLFYEYNNGDDFAATL